MKYKVLEEKIMSWLMIHHDNNVRIDNKHITIIARNNMDCHGTNNGVEYVSIESGCPCCEETTYTYYTFDEIDFNDCVLSLEDASGNTIYDIIDGETTDRFKEKLTEQEIEEFFDKDWYTLGAWSEGKGRSQTHYEIMKAGRITIISMEDYGFDDFNQPIYFYINKG